MGSWLNRTEAASERGRIKHPHARRGVICDGATSSRTGPWPITTGSHGEDGYSGFTERDPVSGDEKPTVLEQTLRSKGVQKVIVVGLATDCCVKATALDAIERRLDVTVLSEAVRAVNREPNDGADALAEG